MTQQDNRGELRRNTERERKVESSEPKEIETSILVKYQQSEIE